jgi:hypothetical protein
MTGTMPDNQGPICPSCGEWFGSRENETDTCAGCGKSWREAHREKASELLHTQASLLQARPVNPEKLAKLARVLWPMLDELSEDDLAELEAEVAEEYQEVPDAH